MDIFDDGAPYKKDKQSDLSRAAMKIEKQTNCSVCQDLEDGDTLYAYGTWDGGIEFNYIHNIHFCPVCGKKLLTYEMKKEEWHHE